MNLTTISTGSKGNCYLLENDSECLIIELGVSFRTLKQALNFNFSKVVGAIVSHEHLDHAKSLKDALNNGIECFASKGTFESLNIQHYNANIIQAKKSFKVGNFKILPFDIHHDVAEPLGFLIEHQDCGRVLFVTDTIYLNYTFPRLNQIIIEANFCEDIIKEKLFDKQFLQNRIFKSHMSITTCRDALLANDLSQVNNIVLIHLSDSNSDEAKFKQIIEQATGRITHVAHTNQTINFSINPF